jgi:hypothetical protein
MGTTPNHGDDEWDDLEMCSTIVLHPGERIVAKSQGWGGSQRNMLDDPSE